MSKSESSKSERASLKGNDQITPAAAEQEQTVVVDTPAAPQKNYFNSFKKGSFKRYNKAASGTRNFFQKSPSQLEMNKQRRDPKGIHENLKVQFNDVIAEPEGTTSFSTIWGSSFKTYNYSRVWCYKIMTLVLGLPIALFWGLYFAILAFINIWLMVPAIKAAQICAKFVGTIWSLFITTVLEPWFTSLGLMFSRIRITIQQKQEMQVEHV